MLTGRNLELAQELLESIRFFNQRGWSPATSTNYSARSEDPQKYLISRSGVDKSKFELSDLILIDSEGTVLAPYIRPGVKSSAETEIHTGLYARFPEAQCVLHTHSVLGTVLSYELLAQGELSFEGLEILKGLEGNATHELREILPIVPNSQDMSEILRNMEGHFASQIHGFLIAGHGLYTWGNTVAAARRHVETFEFLFECYATKRRF